MLYSHRGKDLITKEPHKYQSLLTVENSSKIYDLSLVFPSGKVHVIHPWDVLEDSGWRDDCIVPAKFVEVARKFDALYDYATFEKVCELYKYAQLDFADNPDVIIPKGDMPFRHTFIEDADKVSERKYLNLRAVSDSDDTNLLLATIPVETDNITEHFEQVMLFGDEESQEYYAQTVIAANFEAYRSGMSQVVDGNSNIFWIINQSMGTTDKSTAHLCVSLRHYDLLTENEYRIAQARKQLESKEISVEEFKRIKEENA
jgi:hypothetical protein